ncbi:MAG TPA: DUF1634 domain-containing protein [Chthoniobacterales bacterium]
MKEDRLRNLLASLMLWGVFIAAGIMIIGGVIFLAHHSGMRPGDHKFTGEPADLRHPGAILKAAFRGNDDCLIQAGVLLLLLNPLIRVGLAAWGYAHDGNKLYAGIAGFVFAVLMLSYFI